MSALRADAWGAVKPRRRDADQTFSYKLPTEILFGSNTVEQLGVRLRHIGVSRPLIVTDQGVRSAGIVDTLLLPLERDGLQPAVFDRVDSDPTIQTVEEIRDALEEGDHDSVIGLGGGSPMDAAKAAAALATNPGPVLDYAGKDKVENPPLLTVAVPTTAGTGSEVTMFSVLTDVESNSKVSIASMQIMPRLALLDPELTTGLSPSLTAATGIDALSHAVESYGSVWSHPIAEGLALRAIEITGDSLRRAVADGGDREARRGMLMASLIAELAANSTRLGIAHALAIPVGAQHHVPHGLAVATLLPSTVSFNESADPSRYARIAQALGNEGEPASQTISRLTHDVGIEDGLADWGVEEDGLADLAGLALKSDNVQANPREANREELVMVLREAL